MAFHRHKADWERTAAVVSMVYNMHRDSNSRPLRPSEFNPYSRPQPMTISREESHIVFRQIVESGRRR